MRLLLHACCGPCLLEPYDALVREHEFVVVAYANPNIHPVEEYERRRDVLLAYAKDRDIRVEELEYEPAQWIEAVGPVVRDDAERCRRCYRLRLRMVAEHAVERGFDAVATTLTVSPYQDPNAIREEAEAACASAGVAYVHRDFRSRYAEATRRSRDLGMYRQNYCGCVVSELSARRARAERRAAKRVSDGR